MRSTCLRDATILIETCPGELREQFIDSVTMMFRQTRSGQWLTQSASRDISRQTSNARR
jgi:hypothetical protein